MIIDKLFIAIIMLNNNKSNSMKLSQSINLMNVCWLGNSNSVSKILSCGERKNIIYIIKYYFVSFYKRKVKIVETRLFYEMVSLCFVYFKNEIKLAFIRKRTACAH